MLNALGIINGRDTDLTELSCVPDAGPSMRAWFQKLALVKVITQVIDYEANESFISLETSGVFQPLSGRKLEMKPEGQRAWDWVEIHCENGLLLKPNEIVQYHGTRYRVMNEKDYSSYGYAYYELVNDYNRTP